MLKIGTDVMQAAAARIVLSDNDCKLCSYDHSHVSMSSFFPVKKSSLLSEIARHIGSVAMLQLCVEIECSCIW